MPAFYLLRGAGLYSDFDDYPEKPADRPEGEWVEGEPEGLNRFIEIIQQTPTPTLNAGLESALLGMLPGHLNQPYMSDAVIASIMQAKVAVIDANKIDPSGTLGKAIIRAIALPEEMETDRQNLLAMFPGEV